MERFSVVRTTLLFFALVGLVMVLSFFSGRIWGAKGESSPVPAVLSIEEGMQLSEFGRANGLSNPILKEIFGLRSREELQKQLSTFGSPDQVKSLVTRKLALAAEQGSKNWVKIRVKFGLWLLFLAGVFFTLRARKLSASLRKWLLLAGVLIFGVVMGSDPSPMGTVKDAIHLYGAAGAVFPPRLIALGVFLLMVVLANKYICGWGCQVGVLQDLIFRINQGTRGKAVLARQIRLPFVVTNVVRIAFFCLFTVVAFLWGADMVEPIDPFKIYKPGAVGLMGGVFLGLLLILGLFVYRPWCHLFCPFGLVGWLVEKISRVRISVDYETCIACEKCSAACPSTVMSAILKRDKKTIPDCFACYACRDACPTGAILFSTRKRVFPPKDFFQGRKRNVS
jgi:polyferredoxin